MPLITATVRDVSGKPDNAPWIFTSMLREAGDGSIVTAREVWATPVDGLLSVNLEPGPVVVRHNDATYPILVPATDSDLRVLIETAIAVPPDTPAEVLQDAIASYMAAHPIDPTDPQVIADAVASYLAEHPVNAGASVVDNGDGTMTINF